jgi:hypothetical protein
LLKYLDHRAASGEPRLGTTDVRQALATSQGGGPARRHGRLGSRKPPRAVPAGAGLLDARLGERGLPRGDAGEPCAALDLSRRGSVALVRRGPPDGAAPVPDARAKATTRARIPRHGLPPRGRLPPGPVRTFPGSALREEHRSGRTPARGRGRPHRSRRPDLRSEGRLAGFLRARGAGSLLPFPAERRSQRDNFYHANQQISAIAQWLQRNDATGLVTAIDPQAARTFKVQRVYLVVLGRYVAHFADRLTPDRRAAWGTWPQVLRLVGECPFGPADANPLGLFHTWLAKDQALVSSASDIRMREIPLGTGCVRVYPSIAAYRAATGQVSPGSARSPSRRSRAHRPRGSNAANASSLSRPSSAGRVSFIRASLVARRSLGRPQSTHGSLSPLIPSPLIIHPN